MQGQSFKIEWEAHEYEHKERTGDWYWAVGIVTVSLVVAAVIFGNIILAILIALAVFSLSLFINRHPRITNVAINEKGITRDKIFYPYEALRSFWIDTDHSHKKIFFRSNRIFMPLIIVPLGEDVNLVDLHEVLSHYLHEEPHALPFVEKVLDYLGF